MHADTTPDTNKAPAGPPSNRTRHNPGAAKFASLTTGQYFFVNAGRDLGCVWQKVGNDAAQSPDGRVVKMSPSASAWALWSDELADLRVRRGTLDSVGVAVAPPRPTAQVRGNTTAVLTYDTAKPVRSIADAIGKANLGPLVCYRLARELLGMAEVGLSVGQEGQS